MFGTDWGVGVGEEGRRWEVGEGRWGKARGMKDKGNGLRWISETTDKKEYLLSKQLNELI